MARFDDWVTDPEVTIDRLRAIAADRRRVGERFLGRYLGTTTSGTTGHRGLFLLDDHAAAVIRALSLRAARRSLTPSVTARLLARRMQSAHIVATSGHLAAYAVIARSRVTGRQSTRGSRVLSAHNPLPNLVDQTSSIGAARCPGRLRHCDRAARRRTAGRPAVHRPGPGVAAGRARQ
jgi:hypothetical protein